MDIDNNICFDWLTFSTKNDSVRSVIDLLGLSHCKIRWDSCAGARFYRDRLYYDGISIFYNGINDNMGICVELSGQGCRNFEELSSISFMQLFSVLCSDDGYNVSRLDVAFDDFDNILDLNTIIHDVHEFNFVSKFKPECFRVEEHAGHVGQTVYCGSASSSVMFRIYDKKYEKKRDDLNHWVRFEMQLRNERAFNFIKQLINNDFSIGQGFFGVLNNYLRFVVPSSDSNKRRWDTAPYWIKFLKSLEVISIYTSHDTDYNIVRTEKYIHRQAANSIEALINYKGVDKFLLDLIHDKSEYTSKYEQIQTNNNAILNFLHERGVS